MILCKENCFLAINGRQSPVNERVLSCLLWCWDLTLSGFESVWDVTCLAQFKEQAIQMKVINL